MKKYYQYNFRDVYGEEWETHPVFPALKKDAQLSLEDLYDASVLGTESREDYIRRKMRDLPTCKIMKQTILSGDRVEVELYPVMLNRSDIPRSAKAKESRPAQKNLNNKNRIKQIVRLMCANFHEGDLIVTLTYKDGVLPTQEQARKDMRAFVRKLRAERKKQGLPPLKYIYAIEHADADSKKVRIHHHMIINAMDREIVEKLWTKGRSETKHAQPDDFELEGFATYIAKMTNDKGKHSYSASRNLDKPQVFKSVTQLSRRRFAEIIRMDDKSEIMESLYRGKFRYLDSKTYINQEYGGFYLYARMRRKESVWRNVKMPQSKENTGAGTEPAKPKRLPCRAFLEYDWRGSLADGEARCSILLEAIRNGEPVTQEFYATFKNTTQNRAVLRMAISALHRLNPCEIEFHSNSNILTTGITLNRFERQRKGGFKGTKNADLIKEFLEASKGFELKAVCEGKSEYSDYLKMARKNKEGIIPVLEDKHE